MNDDDFLAKDVTRCCVMMIYAGDLSSSFFTARSSSRSTISNATKNPHENNFADKAKKKFRDSSEIRETSTKFPRKCLEFYFFESYFFESYPKVTHATDSKERDSSSAAARSARGRRETVPTSPRRPDSRGCAIDRSIGGPNEPTGRATHRPSR